MSNKQEESKYFDANPNQLIAPFSNTKKFPHYFYKTKMCPFFISGHCKNGTKCGFAHSEEDLKQTPDLKKTKLCELQMHGKCTRGLDCKYAHGKEDLRQPPDFYKTSLCFPFVNGTCFYGNKCRFAHGVQELKRKQPIDIFNKNTQSFISEYGSEYYPYPSDQRGLNFFEPKMELFTPPKLLKSVQFETLEEKIYKETYKRTDFNNIKQAGIKSICPTDVRNTCMPAHKSNT